MANALKGLAPSLLNTLKLYPQLNTQAAAVTAVAYTSSGAIADGDSVITIATNAQAYTLPGNVQVGRILVITQSGAGTITVTQQGNATFDGTNNTATFNAADEQLVLLGITEKRWLILKNNGSVALSSV